MITTEIEAKEAAELKKLYTFKKFKFWNYVADAVIQIIDFVILVGVARILQ